MKQIYLVRYYGGSYESYKEVDIFATFEKTTATKYVTRFNKMLKKWKDHYKQYEDNISGIPYIRSEHMKYYNRWCSLHDITRCYWVAVEIR